MQQIFEFAQNHPILSLFWVGTLLAIIGTTFSSLTAKFKMVTSAELTLLVNRSDATVLDIRAIDEYKKGHITGAKNIPLDQLPNQLTTLENQKDKPIIVVCFAGMSARGAAATLRKAGFSAVSVLGGGMNAWTAANLPVVKK